MTLFAWPTIWRGSIEVGANCQVTLLKILVSYPDGFAVMEDLKRDMAILVIIGREAAFGGGTTTAFADPAGRRL